MRRLAIAAVLLGAACDSTVDSGATATPPPSASQASAPQASASSLRSLGPAASASPAERAEATYALLGGAAATSLPIRASEPLAPFDFSLRGRLLVEPDLAKVHVKVKAEGVPLPAARKLFESEQRLYSYCYALGYRNNPNLLGEVALTVHLGASGTKVTKGASTLPDASTIQCLVDRLATLPFPKPSGGAAELQVELMFLPGY